MLRWNSPEHTWEVVGELASRPSDSVTVSASECAGLTLLVATVLPDRADHPEVLSPSIPVEKRVPWEVRDRLIPWGRSRALPDWSNPFDGGDAEREYFTGVTLAGFPLKCVWSTLEPADSSPGDELNIPLPKWIRLPGVTDYDLGWRIPYRPIVVALVVDAVIWRFLLVIPGFWRRARRRARGACVSCCYSRTGLGFDAPCPECGHRNPPAS